MDASDIRNALSRAQAIPCGAAVLIPLVEGESGLDMLLEVRAADLAVQPGEVCLPGGRIAHHAGLGGTRATEAHAP